jgi:hypothetical protein
VATPDFGQPSWVDALIEKQRRRREAEGHPLAEPPEPAYDERGGRRTWADVLQSCQARRYASLMNGRRLENLIAIDLGPVFRELAHYRVKPEDFWRTRKGDYSNAAVHHVSLEDDDGCGYDVRDHSHPAPAAASSSHLHMRAHAGKELVSDPPTRLRRKTGAETRQVAVRRRATSNACLPQQLETGVGGTTRVAPRDAERRENTYGY